MKPLLPLMVLFTAIALAGCNPRGAKSADATAAAPTAMPDSTIAPSAPASTTEADAATGPRAMASDTQAGWYTGGTFRACQSDHALTVDKTVDIDRQIKAGGMDVSSPVYVKLEGMPMGDTYMLTHVVQVGSRVPVRDCPMSGTATQSSQ